MDSLMAEADSNCSVMRALTSKNCTVECPDREISDFDLHCCTRKIQINYESQVINTFIILHMHKVITLKVFKVRLTIGIGKALLITD